MTMNCSKGDIKHAESSKPACLLNCELDELAGRAEAVMRG